MKKPRKVYSVHDKPLTTVQGDWPRNRNVDARVELSAAIVQMAEAEYERRYGTDQSIDCLRERGGLGLGEVVLLLADAVYRYAPDDALRPKSGRDLCAVEPESE